MKTSSSSDDEEQDGRFRDTIAHLDLSLVHQKAFPSFWNQVKFDTFPCNYFVIGFVTGSVEKLHVQGDGGGGLLNIIPLLNSDQVQYCGFRISRNRRSNDDDNDSDVVSLKPYFILLRWIGQQTSPLQVQNLEKDLEFVKGYFHNATIIITINESEFNSGSNNNTSSREDHIMEKVLAIVKTYNVNNDMDDLTSSKYDDDEEELDVEYDFMNKNCVTVCTHYDYEDEGDQASMTNDALHNAMLNYENAQREAEEREKAQALNAMDERYDPNLRNLNEDYGQVEVKEDDDYYGEKYNDDNSGADPKAPQATSKPPLVPNNYTTSNNNNRSKQVESKFDNDDDSDNNNNNNSSSNNNNNNGGIMNEGFLTKLGKNGFLNDANNNSNNSQIPPFKDELKRAATSYTDVDKLIDTAKFQDEELKQLELERIKLSQQRMELYQEQAAQQLEVKRQAQHEKLAKRLEERKRRRLSQSKQQKTKQDEDAAMLQQHFSNNAENRVKSKQRTYQRIVERKLQSLEKKSSDGRAQLFNVENTIKLNEDRLHELQLKRAEELRSNYSTRNTKKK